MALSVQPSGHKSWKLIFWLDDRVRWYHLGDADMSIKETRNRAHELLSNIRAGTDVQDVKMKKRREGTFKDLSELYVKTFAKERNRSWKQADYLVRANLLPSFGQRKVNAITRDDVEKLFDEIKQRAPIVANQTLAAGSSIFAWALRKRKVAGLLANPFLGVEKAPTQSRERVLTDEEIPLFWKAFDESASLQGQALKMVLLTGQRPGEVAAMRREHLQTGLHRFTDSNGRSFEAQGAWWNLPGAPEAATGWPGCKNKRNHRVWLSAPAVAIIEELTGGVDAGFVFASPHSGAVSELDRTMRNICAKLEVTNKVVPHDLRRTHGTTVTSLGFSREQMNRLLNHREGGIGSVYDRFGYADEARRIQEAVASRMMSLIEPQNAKIIPLRG